MASVSQGYETEYVDRPATQERFNATTDGNAITEAGRLQAEAERDWYKAALEEIAGLRATPGRAPFRGMQDLREYAATSLATPAGEGA